MKLDVKEVERTYCHLRRPSTPQSTRPVWIPTLVGTIIKTFRRETLLTLMLRSTSVVSTTVAMASIMSRPISTVFLAWSRQASGKPDTQ